ncbi:hypothetical protein [Micromonospora sp. NPDC051006]|uniref:hypothetical protein n=1 Tax=Micromonospora sp. NPDC051006 TaxID=3364283 RepID=UPI0037B476FB
MRTRLHPIARGWRRLGATTLGLVVAGGALLLPAQDAPTLGSVNPVAVAVPAADVLDVAFTGGTATDRAQGLAPTTWGTPGYATEPAIGHDILTVDGSTTRSPSTSPTSGAGSPPASPSSASSGSTPPCR